ncbi:MAG TPA: ABC transporter ATP-binding protein [Anaerolineae bacterium]|nr:ABC transporter ATP-binding protein [Anaerolineae bacterium]
MASVRVKNLRKAYRNVEAVKGLSFSVEDGEFFCLLGPPGAGKTTILRIIAGLEKPDQGEVYLGPDLVNDVPPMERDVAMVFEDLALYPHMTAYDNLAHPLRLRRFTRPEIDRKVREVAETLHISHLLDRRPDTFSGGELRRVAIGRALVRRPKVLLLDQPLTDLDAWLRQEMTGELKKLQRETGQTMIYVTHDFEEAVTMADRIMVVNNGLAEQLGPPEEIYDRPETAFVASFVGSPSMNLIPCRAERQDGQLFLVHAAFRLPMPRVEADIESKKLLAGIRPEYVTVAEGAAEGSISATVDIVQPLGDEQIVDLSLEDGTVIKMIAPLELKLARKDRVGIHFSAEKLSLFDAQSGRRIE